MPQLRSSFIPAIRMFSVERPIGQGRPPINIFLTVVDQARAPQNYATSHMIYLEKYLLQHEDVEKLAVHDAA